MTHREYHYFENWRRGAKFPFALGPKKSLGGPASSNLNLSRLDMDQEDKIKRVAIIERPRKRKYHQFNVRRRHYVAQERTVPANLYPQRLRF